MSRREFIQAGIALAAADGVRAADAPAASAATPAPTPVAPAGLPPRRGPAVWLDLDQAQLDAAYTQSVFAPNLQLVTTRWARASEIALAHLAAPQRVAYGPAPVEQLDIYRTDRANAPIAFFVHGGAWRSGTAREYAFVAEMFVNAGVHCVIPDFAWVQDVGGDLMVLASQVRRALAWTWRNAASFGGDASRLHVLGHSSGAHLGGVLVSTDWSAEGLPAAPIRGAVLTSGMYDLKPVRLSVRSSYVSLTDASEAALSAQRHLGRINAPLVLAHGDLETPEFQRQSRDFAAALKAAGKPVDLVLATGFNHFEVMETLGSPYGYFGRAALAQMGLAAR
jgi:arylformamidase